MEKVRLRANNIPRVESGHLWIYSNELAKVPSLEPGSIVEVFTNDGTSLGLAFFNPHSLIALRLLKISIVQDVSKVFNREYLMQSSCGRRFFPPNTAIGLFMLNRIAYPV
jgi:Predicted SAM-dependent methyltransferases